MGACKTPGLLMITKWGSSDSLPDSENELLMLQIKTPFVIQMTIEHAKQIEDLIHDVVEQELERYWIGNPKTEKTQA